MRALLDDPAAVEHDDSAGLADRRQAVGDDDRRASGEQAAQARLDAPLRVEVDVRGRLVEDQDARVGDERAGERDELALAGRQLRAALADGRLVAVLEALDELVGADGAGGGAHLVVRRVRAPEGDVVADRAAEQEALLGDDPELAAQRRLRDRAQVVAVDEHGAVGRVVEARDELGDRRLACAGRADERDGLAGRHGQRDVTHGVGAVLLAAIAKAHVAQLDLAAQAPELDRVGRVDEVGLDVEQVEDLVQRGHARLVGRVDLRQLLDRVEEAVQREHEGDHDARGDVAVDDLKAAVEQDPDGRQRAQQLDRGEVRGVEVDGRHVDLAVALVELAEALGVLGLLAEGAQDADPRQRLLQIGGDRADRLARALVGVGGDDAEGERAERHDGEDQERQQRELEVQPDEDRDRPDERQRALKERHDAVGDERVQRLHVVGHARDQLAGLAALVEADRLGLQVREDPQAQVLQRALADPADEVGLRVRRRPAHQRADDERDDDEVQRADVALLDAVVDRELRQRRRRERGRGRGDERDEHRDDARRGRDAAARAGRAACARARRSGAGGARCRGAARRALAGHSPATSGSSALRVRKTWSGRPFSTISP